MKCKIDTGAKTSALHAKAIEKFVDHGVQKVRFCLHPIQGRQDIELICEATVLDYREVTDSGGKKEKRYVIRSKVVMGRFEWPIELTLTNRESMSYRMLLGRSAMHRLLVEPSKSFLLGKPKPMSSKHSKKKVRRKP